MRVISGTARGRRLKELPGMDTRPTTDKVKESLFNIIQFDIEGRNVLDLFGGTGQLGIEALSRGAARCTFVDLSRQAAAVIRENVKTVGFDHVSTIHQGDAAAFLAGCREKFDLIFLDPPYQSGLLERCIQEITKFDILAEHGIMICESAVETQLPESAAPYEKGREYRYGKIKLTVYRRQGSF
ncbi:MAG: 16S rRNA (guanine(966)-N(2))-methyltransferase RsmD [Ruminococcaceae bacterium]|nr:16S rRNA (guanine(966)-N(2))-methyltransferase RsmD [Oscillospiraceae bacterium]